MGTYMMMFINWVSFNSQFIIPTKAREYVFMALVCVSLFVSVCLSVTTITKKIVDRFVQNFMGRFLRGKGRPSSCFVRLVEGCGSNGQKLLKLAIVYILCVKSMVMINYTHNQETRCT